ncbi:hypothetical protein ACFPYI_18060 [Halomarina salina]|uniref:PGF-CTERM sorting domain-containing protein n=1 Tax=Halomarina salina TaxID=1872699 RepID=A0ABD5RSW5_9EURY|nr:hypothetical protein [Halomarina salina]
MRTLGTMLVVSLLLFSTIGQSALIVQGQTSDVSDNLEIKKMTSMTGVDFYLAFNDTSHNLQINATNPTNRTLSTGIIIDGDNSTVLDEEMTLSPHENWSTSVNTNSSLDALRTNHVVRASTYGSTRAFEFEYDIDPEHSSVVPTPYIEETEISQAMIDGEQSTVVNVTVVNPSDQQYPTKLMVHTQGTDGSFYAAIVPTGESETVTVELLDDADSTIVGEARLYVDQFNQSDGGIDQVGFEGRVDGETVQWNESYAAVEGPWSDDPYQYQNASVGNSGISDGIDTDSEVRGVPLVVIVAAIGVLSVALLIGRRVR